MPDPIKASLTTVVKEPTKTGTSREQASNPDLNDPEGVPWKNRAKEYEEKYTKLIESHEATNSRLLELEDKVKLSEAEKAEQARLVKSVDALEQGLQDLETNPTWAVYREDRKRVSQRIKEEAKTEALQVFYENTVARMVKKASLEFKIEPSKLRLELRDMVKLKHQEMLPDERVETLIEEYREQLAQNKAEKERLEKEKEERTFNEKSGRFPREQTLEEAKKTGDVLTQLKHLGKYTGKPDNGSATS